jgi:hypothetical protein
LNSAQLFDHLFLFTKLPLKLLYFIILLLNRLE